METKWTPEPWEISQTYETLIEKHCRDDKCARTIASTRCGNISKDMDDIDKTLISENRANARRIVSCVNALAGIENPEEFIENARLAARVLEALSLNPSETIKAIEKVTGKKVTGYKRTRGVVNCGQHIVINGWAFYY